MNPLRKALAVSAASAALAMVGAGPAMAATTGSAGTGDPGSTTPAPSTTNPSPTNPSPNGQAPAGPSGSSCDPDASWPAYVQGAPTRTDGRADGAYLWHNPKGGWGLRVTHPRLPGRADRVVFSGTLTSAGHITGVKGVKLEKGDSVKVSADGHTLAFRFVNYGALDGVDFATSCTPGLKVDVRVDGGRIQPKFIHLGAHGVSPRQDPFLIRRSAGDKGTAPAPAAG